MKHDELRSRLELKASLIPYDEFNKLNSALRTVVQLHKPKNYIIKGFEVTESWCTADSESLTPYPRPTIQAIIKELAC